MNQNSLPWDVFLPIEHPCVKENRYVISPYGIIKNIITGEICKRFFDEHGIAFVPLLSSYKKDEDMYLMRQVDELVAWEYLPEGRDLGNEILHLDGKNDNCYYKNLEWVPWQTIDPYDPDVYILPHEYLIC